MATVENTTVGTIKVTANVHDFFSFPIMILTIALCISAVLCISIQGKQMDDSSPLFENIFLYSDYDPTKLEDLLDSGAIKCFPPADRRHKYEWAGGFNQKHFLDELNNSDNDSNMDNSLEDKPLAIKQLVKKNEKQKTLEHVCACQTKHELVDLGDWHFPRYIVNARCQNRNLNSQKCFRKLRCKEIPYKIRVLTKRFDSGISDNDLPEPLRDIWRFESVTIAAACQCSV